MKRMARGKGTYMSVVCDAARMLCNYCENQSHGACRFCGAGVCRDHMRATRFVSGFEYLAEVGYLSDYVIVDNAIWCGRCAVRPVRNHP